MVVACVALLVALAGTSVAAVTIVIPRNSVGSLQLKANSVTSAKVKNGSLFRADFRAGQVPRGPAGPAGPAGAAGPAGPAGPAGAAGVAPPGYTAETLTQTSASSSNTNSTSFVALDTSTPLAVTVPANETDKLIVTFSAEDACYGGTPVKLCNVRITVDGNEIAPASGGDANFDNNDLGGGVAKTSSDQESRSIVRVSPTLSAGAHSVVVQYQVSNASTTFRLDDWALVVQRVRVT
jgi:hypothetical protein